MRISKNTNYRSTSSTSGQCGTHLHLGGGGQKIKHSWPVLATPCCKKQEKKKLHIVLSGEVRSFFF